MTQAKNGDTVNVHYTGKLDDGTTFDTSVGGDPLQLKIGEGGIIPAFEQAIIGMSLDESKTIYIPADEAYGPRREEMVMAVDKDQLPEDFEPAVGQQLQISQPDGHTFMVTIAAIAESTITLDAHHPLAGENLTFDIQLTEVI